VSAPWLVKTIAPAAAAAVLGNAFVGREALAWFRNLRRPRMQLPMAGFFTVGALYYGIMGVVLRRSLLRDDPRSYRLALVVLAANELWNAALFGRRSTRAGFLGILAFLMPLGLLQASVARDRVSAATLGAYTAYVVAYDVPWAYRLWRLNRDGASGPGRQAMTPSASRPGTSLNPSARYSFLA
jgi:tryptophan-rich sensory protein